MLKIKRGGNLPLPITDIEILVSGFFSLCSAHVNKITFLFIANYMKYRDWKNIFSLKENCVNIVDTSYQKSFLLILVKVDLILELDQVDLEKL